jgi:TRAP-type C4-dicarboxylate transport system substrate-binding protein
VNVAAVARDLAEEQAALDAEFADFKPLFFTPFPQNFVHATQPFASFEDLAGRKMMAEAPPVAEFLGGFGATVLSIPLIDQYQAMQTVTGDGNVITYTVFESMQMKEVAKHHYEFPMGSAMGMVFMDKQRYESLSDEAKAVLDANSGCDVSMEAGARIDQWAADVKASMVADGDHTFTTPTTGEVAAVRKDHLQNVVEGYSAFTKDINGREIIERWIELADAALAAR